MLRFWILPVLGAVLSQAVMPAVAQVTVDLHALQALPGAGEPSAVRPPPRPAPRPAAHPSAEVTTPGSEKAPPAASVATTSPAAQPDLPRAVPDTASITPIPPAPEGVPPPPPTVSETAATVAQPTQAGLRLTFAPGQSDLSPDSVTSLKTLAQGAPTGDTVSFNIMAYAPGSPDDPSTARRVSLSRAMAVRSALVGDGISSARIYVRALGAQYGSGPPDRVDVSVLGGNGATQSASDAARNDASVGLPCSHGWCFW